MENEQKTAGRIKKRAEELFGQIRERAGDVCRQIPGNRNQCASDYRLYLQPAGSDGNFLAALRGHAAGEDDRRLHQCRVSPDGAGPQE